MIWKISKKVLIQANLIVLFIIIFEFQVYSKTSLYEKYANASQQDLNNETGQIAIKLDKVFDENEILIRQSEIDFAEYFSNFKNLIYFCYKLSLYSSYHEDLKFGKDKELFKGLPDYNELAKKENQEELNEFINIKYVKMKENIDQEIKTYDDMAQICIDACLAKLDDMFFKENIIIDTNYNNRFKQYFQNNEFQKYLSQRSSLIKFRPELVKNIDHQLSLWNMEQISMESPIIDKKIVEQL